MLDHSRVSIEAVRELDSLDHSTVARVLIEHPIRSIIIKESNSLVGLDLARREARFYERIAPLLSREVSPKCFGVESTDETLVLVLEDLGFAAEADSTPPSENALVSYVEALAKLSLSSSAASHLRERWESSFGVHPYNHIQGRAEYFPDRLDRFLGTMGRGFESDVVSLLNKMTSLAKESEFQHGEVVVHGDAHLGNAVTLNGETRLLDWANAALGFGEIDLAHLVALNLPPDTRRACEAKLLKLYASLTGSDIRIVRRRYKLGVLYAIESAIGMWEFGVPNWEELLGNAFDAAVDLNAHSELAGGSL